MGILCKIEITRPRQPDVHGVGSRKTIERISERNQILKRQGDIVRRHKILSGVLAESLQKHSGSDEEFSERVAEIVYGNRSHIKEMLVQKQQERYDRYLKAITAQLTMGNRISRKMGSLYEWWYARQIPTRTTEILNLVKKKGRKRGKEMGEKKRKGDILIFG